MAARYASNSNWKAVRARITACRESAIGREHMDFDGHVLPNYRVSFSYEVGGRVHTGSYLAHSRQEVGETIEILYDPARPKRNSLADALSNPRIKFGAWVVCIVLAVLLIWFWGGQHWFSN